ncbi:hypothetical protein SUGI_0005810 [Cryptomeria japonica]|nr:hypothetical protein SUGI_0005810 [Cryptomeria japonica]
MQHCKLRPAKTTMIHCDTYILFGVATAGPEIQWSQSYVVTSSEDSPQSLQPGSLRYGLGKGNVWITFSRSMKILLKDKLLIPSSTTIDGRGVTVTIGGAQLALPGVSNVILHNLQIDAPVDKSETTIHVSDDSILIWMDHLTFVDPTRMTCIGKIISVNTVSMDDSNYGFV